MLRLKYQINKNGLLNVTVRCSKCGAIYTVMTDRLEKLYMTLCPHCNNIDLERTNGLVPISVQKTLLNFAEDTNIEYFVEGQSLEEFIPRMNDKQTFTGLYRLKSFYSTYQKKNLLDVSSFPDFETFMRWATNAGYRDWKTIKLDDNNRLSVNAHWEPGMYIKEGIDDKLIYAAEAMTVIMTARDSLKNLHKRFVDDNTKMNIDTDLEQLDGIYLDLIRTLSSVEGKVSWLL